MMFKTFSFSSDVVLSVGAIRHYRKAGSVALLSPHFIDRFFNFLSIVGSDSAEGSVASYSVFNRCSANHTSKLLQTHIDKKDSMVTLPKPLRVYSTVNRSRVSINIKSPHSRLFRKKCSNSFLLINLTRSFLSNTEMYSVYCRNIIILSLRNVKLHLSFDYTDKSFVDDVLSTDISVYSFFNS